MKPGQKPLVHAVAIIAGLQAMHPDETVNKSAEMLNGCLCEMLFEIMGEAEGGALMEAAIAALAPDLEKHFGIKIMSTATLNRQAAAMTDDLIAKLRKEGL